MALALAINLTTQTNTRAINLLEKISGQLSDAGEWTCDSDTQTIDGCINTSITLCNDELGFVISFPVATCELG